MAYTYDRVLKDTNIDDAEMRVRDAVAMHPPLGAWRRR